MTPTATAALESAARERADYAGAGRPRPPCPGPAGDRTIAGEIQPAATARSGVQAGITGVPGGLPGEGPAQALPGARNVLAVIARPGQESVDLGAMLHTFRRRCGARLALLCLTQGEASPLNSTCERLETIRSFELQVATGLLGVSSVMVADYPDGGLRLALMPELTERVRRAIRWHAPDLLLVVDPASASDPEDAYAAKAACLAAAQAGLPVLARSRPGACGGWVIELGADAAAARAIQRCAAGAHLSQSAAGPQVLRRLDLLGGRERLRWLIPPSDSRAGEGPTLS
jgi:LmbE family N-acetylglucosaminyl deacetylase